MKARHSVTETDIWFTSRYAHHQHMKEEIENMKRIAQQMKDEKTALNQTTISFQLFPVAFNLAMKRTSWSGVCAYYASWALHHHNHFTGVWSSSSSSLLLSKNNFTNLCQVFAVEWKSRQKRKYNVRSQIITITQVVSNY